MDDTNVESKTAYIQYFAAIYINPAIYFKSLFWLEFALK
jgi:hypothetical protein